MLVLEKGAKPDTEEKTFNRTSTKAGIRFM